MSKPIALTVYKPVFANDLWGGSPRMSFVVGGQGVTSIQMHPNGVVVIEDSVPDHRPLYMFPGGASALGIKEPEAEAKK